MAKIPGWARLVNVLENSFAKRKRNKGAEVASREEGQEPVVGHGAEKEI